MAQETRSRRRIRHKMMIGIGVAAAALVLAGPSILDWARQRLGDFMAAGIWYGGGGLQVRSMSFSPDGKRLAVGYSFPPLTCIWDVNSGAQSLVIEENKEHESLEKVQFSPDGKLLAVGIKKLSETGGGETCIRVRDAETGKLIKEIDGNYWSNFTPDGNLLLGGYNIYKMPEGDLIRHIDTPTPEGFWSTGVWLENGGKLLGTTGSISGTDHPPYTIAIIYDFKTGQSLKSLESPNPESNMESKSIGFHPDGKHLVIGTVDDAFYVWNIETNDVKVIRRKGGRWWAVKYSPSGDVVAASGAGGTVLIWDMNKNKEICALKRHFGSVYAVEFNPNGDLLATGGMDGTVRLWGMTGCFWKGWGLVKTLNYGSDTGIQVEEKGDKSVSQSRET